MIDMSFQSKRKMVVFAFLFPVQIAKSSPALLAQFPREINEARGLEAVKSEARTNNQRGRRSVLGKGRRRKETNSTNTPSTKFINIV